jgi:hypothetical protein
MKANITTSTPVCRLPMGIAMVLVSDDSSILHAKKKTDQQLIPMRQVIAFSCFLCIPLSTCACTS